MSATATKPTLNEITRAETEAQAAATKAAHAAEVARAKADLARQRADDERARAYKGFLDKIVAEHPAAREQALTAAGESRAALEAAVRTDDGVFTAYVAWVADSIHVWKLDSELAQIRDHHGIPVRATDPPAFRFDVDVSMIVDGIAAEFQDDALQRIVDRRVSFVNGGASK
jgi:multidrug efflux pump subunit AcrA (membrane-fusion protein)